MWRPRWLTFHNAFAFIVIFGLGFWVFSYAFGLWGNAFE